MNHPTSPEELEGTQTIPFGRRRGQRVLAPARHLSRRWRATAAHKVYSLKLYDALQRSRRSTTVRDTADKVLAATARGTTRWSRAILVSRHKHTKPASAVRGGGGRRRRRKLSVVGYRVRALGGLVPGCKRTALPELLDETADYIAALEMQVRAMTALTKILSEFKPSVKLGSAS